MSNYKEYLLFNEKEYAEKQEKIINKIEIKKDVSVFEDKEMIIYAEVFCPDCRVLVAIIENIIKQCNNFKVKYVKREQGLRIPTIYLIKDEEKHLIFNEFPEELKAIMTDELKREYRLGKYNELIIDTLIKEVQNVI